MKKILLISFLCLLSCDNKSKTLKFKVDCQNIIYINDKKLNLNEIKEIVIEHRSKYNLEAKFKVEACSETSVKILIDLKNIIKLKSETKTK